MSKRRKQAKRRKLIERDGLVCGICFERLTEKTATIDHIRPKSLGGTNELENLRLAHRSCNGSRSNGYDGRRPSAEAAE
jgi:5-methylcytosine-specific restriction endonuclease McrA